MDKKVLKLALIITAIAVIFTLAVCVFDVKPIGPNGSEVGFSSINSLAKEALGTHIFWYNVSEVMGYVSIAFCVVFACIGLVQATKRKSLFKVDRDIVVLGCIYIITIILYVLFDKLALNYRPVMLEGELEASFPSSHTMLAAVVMGTAIIEFNKRLEGKISGKVLVVLCAAILAVTVAGRLISGVHWLTDIFGGLFYSLALIVWFVCFAFVEKEE